MRHFTVAVEFKVGAAVPGVGLLLDLG